MLNYVSNRKTKRCFLLENSHCCIVQKVSCTPQYDARNSTQGVSERSSSWMTEVEGDPKAPFSLASTRGAERGGRHSFPLCFYDLSPVIKLLPICRPHKGEALG